MSKKKFGVVLGAVVFAAVVAVGIWYFLGNGFRDSNDRVYVEKVSVIMGTATGAQNRYSGLVQPQETIEINADSEREVKEVLVKIGDAVEVGTPLFNYDTDELTMELEQAKLELENQDIEIKNFQSQITELEKEKNAAAESEKFEYTTQIQTLQTEIKQAEFEKSSKQLEIDKIQKKVDDSQVLSTGAGVVKSINDGETQDFENSNSAFITILSTGEYRVKGTVNEQNIGMISEGVDVIIRSRVDEEVTWRGMIESIDTGEVVSEGSAYADEMEYTEGESMTASSKYPFYVTLDDAAGLMLGQHVYVELDQGQAEEKEGLWLYSGYIVFEDEESLEEEFLEELTGETESLWLEDTEEIEDTEAPQTIQQAYVWAADENGRLEKRQIEVGGYDEELDEYEIISGLTEDDKIAWPMAGLYEGIITVTDMEEIDYSSGLYNLEGGTEGMWLDTEGMQNDTEDWSEEEDWYEDEAEGEEDIWYEDEAEEDIMLDEGIKGLEEM